MSIRTNLINFFSVKEKDNIYNFYALSVAVFLGHIFFGYYWNFINPQQFEIPTFRIIGLLSSITLFIISFNNKKFSNYRNLSKFCWYFTAIYNLPFFFTLSLIYSNYSPIWLAGEVIVIFVILMFFSGIMTPLLVLSIGVISAVLTSSFLNLGVASFHPELEKVLPIYLLAIGSAYIFSISNNLGFSLVKEVEFEFTKKALKSLAGSIAHEIRNPLNSISLLNSEIEQIANNLDESPNQKKTELFALKKHMNNAIASANNIINLILSDLSEKPIEESEFRIVHASKTINDIVLSYGFNDESEKDKVKVLINSNSQNPDFFIKIIPERFEFIIYNLLKNALYYLKTYPNSIIKIGSETRTFTKEYLSQNQITLSPDLIEKELNVIYVYDAGPGISPENITKLFNDFFTSGKIGGTGLGLSFCKKNMRFFKGDIICESMHNNQKTNSNWTKFSLVFPKVSDEEIAKTNSLFEEKLTNSPENKDYSIFKNKHIILADDDVMSRRIMKRKIEQFGANIFEASNGIELFDLYSKNIKTHEDPSFDLILTDINMEGGNGDDATKKIREIEREIDSKNYKKIPIIALSGDGKEEDINHYFACDMNDYFVKGGDVDKLIDMIAKHLRNH